MHAVQSSRPDTYADLLQRARAMVPRLRELVDAGLFEIQKPARFGGLELGLEEFVEVTAALGRGCGSTAWVYGVTAERAWLLAKFDARAQADVWDANRGALITSSITPDGKAIPVDGGFRVSGLWHFVSGIDIAHWSVFCTWAPAETAGAPLVTVYVLVPVAQCQVIDTWHVAGLAATGSRDVRLDDVFVPAHRVVNMLDLKEGGGPGLAEGALELTLEGARARRLVTTGNSAGEQQSVQLRIAEAAAEIDTARALIMADCRDATATVERGAALSVDQRIRIRRNQGFATRLLMAAVDRLFAVAGGRGIHLDHYMQRAFRDIHAAGSHLGLSWDLVGTMWGQHALGLKVTTPAY